MKKQTILVTGGCGFIGSNFINRHFDKFEKLINIDAMYYCADEYFINPKIRKDENYILVKS